MRRADRNLERAASHAPLGLVAVDDALQRRFVLVPHTGRVKVGRDGMAMLAGKLLACTIRALGNIASGDELLDLELLQSGALAFRVKHRSVLRSIKIPGLCKEP